MSSYHTKLLVFCGKNKYAVLSKHAMGLTYSLQVVCYPLFFPGSTECFLLWRDNPLVGKCSHFVKKTLKDRVATHWFQGRSKIAEQGILEGSLLQRLILKWFTYGVAGRTPKIAPNKTVIGYIMILFECNEVDNKTEHEYQFELCQKGRV